MTFSCPITALSPKYYTSLRAHPLEMGQRLTRAQADDAGSRLGQLEAQTAQLKVAVAASNSELWQAIEALDQQLAAMEQHAALLLQAAQRRPPGHSLPGTLVTAAQTAAAGPAQPPIAESQRPSASHTQAQPGQTLPSQQVQQLQTPRSNPGSPKTARRLVVRPSNSNTHESQLLQSWLQPITPSATSAAAVTAAPASAASLSASVTSLSQLEPNSRLGLRAVQVESDMPPRGKRTLPKDLRLAATDAARTVVHNSQQTRGWSANCHDDRKDCGVFRTFFSYLHFVCTSLTSFISYARCHELVDGQRRPSPTGNLPTMAENPEEGENADGGIGGTASMPAEPVAMSTSEERLQPYQRYEPEPGRVLFFDQARDVVLQLACQAQGQNGHVDAAPPPAAPAAAGFGFSVAASHNPASGDTAFFVSNVKPGGLAAASGRLFKHDRILAVNDSNVSTCSHSDVVQLIRSAQPELRLRVASRIKAMRRRESVDRQTVVDRQGSAERQGSVDRQISLDRRESWVPASEAEA